MPKRLNQTEHENPRRRPRWMKEGRDWDCIFCQKSYFRLNSLAFHVKQKHDHEPTAKQFV